MDLSKLPSAPWTDTGFGIYAGGTDAFPCYSVSVREFVVLARNAFDVMMRRGWSVTPTRSGWKVRLPDRDHPVELVTYADPFTALVEADALYREHVEKPVSPAPPA